jgi:hypothetical protein
MMVAGTMAAYDPAPDAGYPAGQIVQDVDAATAFKADCIVLNGLIHRDADIQARLEEISRVCQSSTRVLIVHYSSLWQPAFGLAQALGLQASVRKTNWIAPSDLVNLLTLAGYNLVSTQARVLVPVWITVIADLINTSSINSTGALPSKMR